MEYTRIYYRIFNNDTKEYEHAMVGAGTNRTQTEFDSVEGARSFNCHGKFKDKITYSIHKFVDVITSDEMDCDPPDEIWIKNKKREEEECDKFCKENGISDFIEQWNKKIMDLKNGNEK